MKRFFQFIELQSIFCLVRNKLSHAKEFETSVIESASGKILFAKNQYDRKST